MVSITGDAKVIDFGVAISNKLRRHTAVDERGTPKLVYGKPAYYAPEQFMTRALDPRTDIYGLGLVLLELITGRQAIPPDTRIQDLLVARDRLAAQLWERYTAIPAEVLRVVERMIAVSPDDRFGSMENVITALERAMPESALTTTRNFIARFAQVGVCLDQAADHKTPPPASRRCLTGK
jgi:serine/threonine-protein kinase